MDEERTYGIEIEAACKVDQSELAYILNMAFEENPETRVYHAYAEGYEHTTDGQNRHKWYVKYDSSILIDSNYQYRCEVVTPVLQGREGLKIVKIVCNVLKDYCKINIGCGLHVHHGIKADETDGLRNLINQWLTFEKDFFSVLPNSRQRNNMAKALTRYVTGPMPHNMSVRRWWRTYLNDRYYAINMESYWLRGTVEFRLHSGTVEYRKIKNWLVATQEFCNKALTGKQPVETSFEGLINYLQTENTGGTGRKLYKQGTIARDIVDRIFQGVNRQDLLQYVKTTYGLTEKRAKSTISHRIWCLKSTDPSKGYGYLITIGNDGYIKAEIPVNRTEDRLTIGACNWLRHRRSHFEGQRQGATY